MVVSLAYYYAGAKLFAEDCLRCKASSSREINLRVTIRRMGPIW